MKDPVRHARGEYYTPRWLADLILDQAGYRGAPGQRILDPSCGLGVFLESAIARARAWGAASGEPPSRTARRILAEIHGYERNPDSAAHACRAYLEAMGVLGVDVDPTEIPVLTADVILNPPATEPFDLVAGNPPWVRWDHLPEDYRAATLPLWKRYGLFSLKGFSSVLGGGKKDLCMLFTYVAADHFLKDGGVLAFLVSQEVFKSKGAGEGFRRFRLGECGEELQVLAAHDFTLFQPFPGAVNKTAAIVLAKGRSTRYPVPYYRWSRSGQGRLTQEALEARPVGGFAGPWRTEKPGAAGVSLEGPNAYRAALGANANPYGVFWLEVLESLPGGLAKIRNLPELGKTAIPAVEAVIEAEQVYPALRGRDIQPWRAVPRVHVLIAQDPETRSGHSEDLLRRRWPRTWEYLSQFRDLLLSRALYRRYHQRARRPFYSQFNIGPDLFAPFKVVWKRMAGELCAAVISRWDGPLGSKLLLPLETTCYIATQSEAEARYLCALLNSEPVRSFVKSFSAAGRGFGAPSALSHLRLPRFDPGDPRHLALAEAPAVCGEEQGTAAALGPLVQALLSEESSRPPSPAGEQGTNPAQAGDM